MHHVQPMLRRFWPLILGALALLLTACPGVSGGGSGGGAPQISSFTANPMNVISGAPVTLSWTITGSATGLSIDNNVGEVIGTNKIVNPTATTTYTLTASNGSDTATKSVTVTVDGTQPPPSGTKTVSFGVSKDQGGPFTGDGNGGISAGDPRIVNVAAGDTFYASVSYSGPAPVTGVTIYIANSSPPGLMADLAVNTNVKGFTLGEAVGGCTVDGTQPSVTCIYPITVASGIPNITGLPGVSGEFAYVFRTRITDTAGGVPYDEPPRGYVTVGGSAGTPPTTPPTPGNRDPEAAFTNVQTASDATGVTYKFSAVDSSDPDGDALSYAWNFGDGSSATTRDFTKKYTASDNYEVTLTVKDSKGGSDTETKTLTVAVPGSPPPPVPTTYNLTVTQTGGGNVVADPKGENCGIGCVTYAAGTEVTLTAKPDNGASFSGWGGACADAGTSSTCEVTVDSAKNVTATFTAASATYQLRVSQTGRGNVGAKAAVKGAKCESGPNLGCTIYPANTAVTLTAIGVNSTFLGWGGACAPSGTSPTCPLTLDGNKDVIANFSQP